MLLLLLFLVNLSGANSFWSSASTASPPSRHLLIGGEDALPHRFPYFVSLEHYCGGALIAPDIVLTAGHCKPGRHDKVRPAVGRYAFPRFDSTTGRLRTKDDASDAEYLEVESAHRHPRWNDPGDDEFVHDFAIIKLATISTKPYVRINRNDRRPFDGESVLVLGAGNTIPDRDSRSSVLQQVTLQAVSNEKCELASSVKRNASYEGRIDSSHLCTGYGSDNSRDACDYDSGSPILIARTASPRDDVLVGLVSWGMECADPDFPGVNARVSDAADWIDEMVCKLSAHPPRGFCPPAYKRWFADATGFATGFVSALLLVAVCATGKAVMARSRNGASRAAVCRGGGCCLRPFRCSHWWSPEHQKLMPLKTDSSLSSTSSDASSDTSYGSVGNVEVLEHPGGGTAGSSS